MSWQAMEHVQDNAAEWGLTNGELCVMLAIARSADAQGQGAFPGPKTIGQRANVTPASAKKIVARLREKGCLMPTGISRLGTQTYSVAGMGSAAEGGNHGSPGGMTVPPGNAGSPGTMVPLGGEPRFPGPGNDGSPKTVRKNVQRDRPSARGARADTLHPKDSIENVAEHVAGVLQRAVDGLTTEERCRPVTISAVIDVLQRHRPAAMTAKTCAIQARSTAQAQDRAPNIVGLFEQKLAQAAESSTSRSAAA